MDPRGNSPAGNTNGMGYSNRGDVHGYSGVPVSGHGGPSPVATDNHAGNQGYGGGYDNEEEPPRQTCGYNAGPSWGY